MFLCALVALRPSRTNVNLLAFDRIIHTGMTANDIEGVLGPPIPQSKIPSGITVFHHGPDGVDYGNSSFVLFWYDGRTLLEVYFDDKQRVVGHRVYRE